MIQETNMTYGEKRIKKLNSINFKKKIEDITENLEDKSSLPPRLPREEAISYYNDKLQKAFAKSVSTKPDTTVSKPKVTMLY